MKVLDILENELLAEMAAAADPEKIVALIKKGDFKGAAAITKSKSSGKLLGSVPANVKELIDAKEVAEYRAALQNSKPSKAKGANLTTAQKKSAEKVKNAVEGKIAPKSAKASKRTINTLSNNIQKAHQANQNDSKLSDEDKESSAAALQVLGEVIPYLERGVAVLPKGTNNKERDAKIAKGKLSQAETERAQDIENEKKRNDNDNIRAIKGFKEKTGEDFFAVLDKMIKNGALEMSPNDRKNYEEMRTKYKRMISFSKKKTIKENILGNSGIN